MSLTCVDEAGVTHVVDSSLTCIQFNVSQRLVKGNPKFSFEIIRYLAVLRHLLSTSLILLRTNLSHLMNFVYSRTASRVKLVGKA